MAKKFSIVTIGDEHEVFLPGYVDFKDLSNSDTIVRILSEISSFLKVHIEINHCLFLDFPDPIEDIDRDDLAILVENFDDLIDKGYIYSEEMADADINGVMDDEIVEENV